MKKEYYGSYRDPCVFENPIEASMELADVTKHRLPDLRRRSIFLMVFGIIWTVAMGVLALVVGYSLVAQYLTYGSVPFIDALIIGSLLLVYLLSAGFGSALIMLAIQERRFHPYLEGASGAMTELADGTKDKERLKRIDKLGKGQLGMRAPAGSALAGILDESLNMGQLALVAGRMTMVARAALAVIFSGLVIMLGLMVIGYLYFPIIFLQAVTVAIIFAIFAVPAIILFKWLHRDHDFYNYYQARQAAVSAIATMGIPPVPEGDSPMERYDTFIRAAPAFEDAVAEDVDKDTVLYSAGGSTVMVRLINGSPSKKEIDTLLKDASRAGVGRGITITLAVALVTTDDIQDEVYEHIIDTAKRKEPKGTGLQMVMEVEGLYSMVPYIAI